MQILCRECLERTRFTKWVLRWSSKRLSLLLPFHWRRHRERIRLCCWYSCHHHRSAVHNSAKFNNLPWAGTWHHDSEIQWYSGSVLSSERPWKLSYWCLFFHSCSRGRKWNIWNRMQSGRRELWRCEIAYTRVLQSWHVRHSPLCNVAAHIQPRHQYDSLPF